jgi:hypothetical protein
VRLLLLLEAENTILIELEDVVLPFCSGALLPSTAELIVVSGGMGVVLMVLYLCTLESADPYKLSPAKCACIVHPVATVFGEIPLAVNVPSGLVVTEAILLAPVPVNVIVFSATPALPTLSANLPVTVTAVPEGTLAIVLSVRVVECTGAITETVLPSALLPSLVTYRLPLAESNAIPYGLDPTWIGLPITVLV